MQHTIRFPDVTVVLTSGDENIFSIIGTVQRALRRAGHVDEVSGFTDEIRASKSYDDVLRIVMRWVNVE